MTPATNQYAGANGGKINLSSSQMRTGIALYPEETKDQLEWLWGYMHQQLSGQVKVIEHELGVPYLDIYHAYTGRPSDLLDTLLTKIRELRARMMANLSIVRTPVTDAIEATLDYARDSHSMVSIVGPTGRGKTYTARYWAARNNHGKTRFIRMTAGASRTSLLYQLCEASGTGYRGYKSSELEMRVLHAFDSSKVLIVDEAGHLIPRSGSSTGALELIRDIHDYSDCAVVLIFTEVYLSLMRGGRLREFYEQFIGRIERTTHIPQQPGKKEVGCVVRHFAPEADAELLTLAWQSACAGDGKLRTLFRDLNKARLLADDGGRPMTALDLQAAIDWRNGVSYNN